MQQRSPASAAHGSPIPRFAVPLDENGFVDWLIGASPGDKLVYYRGHLGHDRMPSTKVLERSVRVELHALATRVMVTAAQGLVLPVQKRVGPEDCLYIAVKAQPSRVGSVRRAAAPTPLPLDWTNSAEPPTIPLAA
jgi:hypothetical protein